MEKKTLMNVELMLLEDLVMNEILWQGIKGKSAPSPVRAAFVKEKPKKDND
jgi:hypothetical protein